MFSNKYHTTVVKKYTLVNVLIQLQGVDNAPKNNYGLN